MAKLIYSTITSLDGFVEDAEGKFGWAAPDDEVQTTLATVVSARTRIEREFDPEAVGLLKATAGHALSVGGAELAARAVEAGLVDELQLFLVPVLVGAGKHSLPAGICRELELLDERRFRNGTVYLRYEVTAPSS